MTVPVDLPPSQQTRTRIAVVTGSRAEFGLLRPVMKAVEKHPHLELAVIAAGSHLVSPGLTYHEVKKEFLIAAAIPMQVAGRTGRAADVEAVGIGVSRFGRMFEQLKPGWVVVLGDRIEAFAGAAAAGIGGFALAHIHGGDRAEGVADEAMRHAISKMAHLHFPATAASGERLLRMGEDPARVHVVGSPAIDDLAAITSLNDTAFAELGSPTVLFLMHPIGRDDETEEAAAAQVLEGLSGARVLALHPNLDPGRDGTLRAILGATGVVERAHLPRAQFVGVLKRLASGGGVMVGNSSAALIEAAAIGLPAVDVGRRQAGRERCGNVIHVEREGAEDVRAAVSKARTLRGPHAHPFGKGNAGERIAAILAAAGPEGRDSLRKRCTY
ncbi:GDP/UDP-N,N'-diacetylbacillosamine 2-epimerase (hydrolysing) [Phycisphaerales bacterium]|nr:GDP/UDP-N,N'-diacetylbacillosamine 2-epimerase (hydrolysing) [Phycisphaerales bacterium]